MSGVVKIVGDDGTVLSCSPDDLNFLGVKCENCGDWMRVNYTTEHIPRRVGEEDVKEEAP